VQVEDTPKKSTFVCQTSQPQEDTCQFGTRDYPVIAAGRLGEIAGPDHSFDRDERNEETNQPHAQRYNIQTRLKGSDEITETFDPSKQASIDGFGSLSLM
jgi:hypothetical protein